MSNVSFLLKIRHRKVGMFLSLRHSSYSICIEKRASCEQYFLEFLQSLLFCISIFLIIPSPDVFCTIYDMDLLLRPIDVHSLLSFWRKSKTKSLLSALYRPQNTKNPLSLHVKDTSFFPKKIPPLLMYILT